MILLDENTKCLVQGITGKQGSFHTEQMLKYNTCIEAGVTPGKGGQEFLGVPIFNSIEETVEETDVNSSIIFVPAKFAKDAAFESIRHLDLVVIISEHIPVHDSLEIMAYAKQMDTTVIGPNTPGVISPGVGKLGIMPTHIFDEGNVGVIASAMIGAALGNKNTYLVERGTTCNVLPGSVIFSATALMNGNIIDLAVPFQNKTRILR